MQAQRATRFSRDLLLRAAHFAREVPPRTVSLTRYRLLPAGVLSLVVTAGLVLMFGIVGLIIAVGGNFLTDAMDWAGLVIGVVLTLLGIWLLVTRNKIYSGAAQRLAARIDPGRSSSLKAFFLFGIAYGIASLSCALPIFLSVAVGALVAGEYLTGLLRFVTYALGMGTVLMILTISTALFKGAVNDYVKKLMPWVERLTPILVIVAGLFIVAYWLTIGGLGEHIPLIPGSETFVEEVIGRVSNNGESFISALPVAHAFGAGMIATINPCGFALLPAYLSLFLGRTEVEATRRQIPGTAVESQAD